MTLHAVLDESPITFSAQPRDTKVTILSNGNQLLYWYDATTVDFGTDGGSSANIHARIYGPDWTPIGPEFVLNNRVVGFQRDPLVVALADGGFAASWYSEAPGDPADNSSTHVAARIFGADGTALSNEFVANAVTPGFQTQFELLQLAGGNIATLYQNHTGAAGLRARFFDVSGNAVGNDVMLGGTEAGRFYTDAQALDNGGFILTWSETVGGKYDVRAQVFDNSGIATGSAFTINQDTSRNESFGSVTKIGDGRLLAQWKTEANFNNTTPGNNTMGRILNADGTPSGNEFLLSERADNLVTVTSLADGGFAVAWVERAFDNPNNVTGSNLDFGYFQWITAQRFDANGIATGPEFQWEVGGHVAYSAISHTIGITAFYETTPGRLGLAWSDNEITFASNGTGTQTGGTSQFRFIDFSTTNASPEIIWEGGGDVVNLQLAEVINAGTASHDFGRVSAQDVNGNILSYLLSGEDAAFFTLDPVSGRLIFNEIGNFEAPKDADRDNVYKITVTVSDGQSSDSQAVMINITNVVEGNTIFGTAGNDIFSATRSPLGQPRPTDADEDTIFGGEGNDSIDGAGGADLLHGGNGNDTYTIDHAGDQVFENTNAGIDTVKSALVDVALAANVERATLTGSLNLNATGNALDNILTGNSGSNVLSGGDGKDNLIGSAGDDILVGGNGNDILNGGTGNDALNGGVGDDTYYVDSVLDVVSELLNEGSDTVRAAMDYVLGDHLEKLLLEASGGAIDGTGNSLANTVTGNAFDNVLTGLGGRDTLSGGDGSDILIGGAGGDSLTGGLGSDTFVFDSLTSSADKDAIRDFVAGTDQLAFSRAAFSGFAGEPAGDLSASAFALGTAATSASHRLIYNSTTGALFYDADGVSGAAQVQIAVMTGIPALSASDIVLI